MVKVTTRDHPQFKDVICMKGAYAPKSFAHLDRLMHPLRVMSGMWAFSDAQLTADDHPDLIDREQGIPHIKGVPCRLSALPEAEVRALEAQFGPIDRLPLGPEGRVAPSRVQAGDFMADEISGDGVEFEAVELALYGRNSL